MSCEVYASCCKITIRTLLRFSLFTERLNISALWHPETRKSSTDAFPTKDVSGIHILFCTLSSTGDEVKDEDWRIRVLFIR